MLAACGAVGGVALAAWGVDIIKALGPALPGAMSLVTIDLRVLVFAVIVGSVTTLVFGLAPGLHLSSLNLTDA